MSSDPQGKLVEVFSSIQGEGYQVGALQVFVRMAGCNLSCRVCDTKMSWGTPAEFQLKSWGNYRSVPHPSPIKARAFADLLEREYPLDGMHSVSFTGGEPLLQIPFVAAVAQRLHRRGTAVFIETNGTISAGLEPLLPVVDFWSVDLKLSRGWGLANPPPSPDQPPRRSAGSRSRSPKSWLATHKALIDQLDPERTFLKLVLDSEDDPDVLTRALQALEVTRFRLVLQPFSTTVASLGDWDGPTIQAWIRELAPLFKEVRWIPQVHKLLRIP
jgi:organic radical activating enzyme